MNGSWGILFTRIVTPKHSTEAYLALPYHNILILLVGKEGLELTYVLRIPTGQQKTADAMRLSTVMHRAGWERGENKITIYGKQVRGFFRWIKDE